jgi:glutaminyl-tRNA synthetase
MVGTTRSDGVVDVAMLEHAIRDDLNRNAPRAMAVLAPLKVVLTNYPEDRIEQVTAANHPGREELGERQLPFTRELYIDAEDFREEANKKYKRLVLGKRVRLRSAYVIEADEAVKDADGRVIEVKARVIGDTVGRDPQDGVKPKGVIHWVSASEGRRAEVRLYDRLFNHPEPDKAEGDFLDHINPDSLQIITDAWVEPALVEAAPEQGFQFEREGYFVADRWSHSAATPVFNRTIGLRDSWNDA